MDKKLKGFLDATPAQSERHDAGEKAGWQCAGTLLTGAGSGQSKGQLFGISVLCSPHETGSKLRHAVKSYNPSFSCWVPSLNSEHS